MSNTPPVSDSDPITVEALRAEPDWTERLMSTGTPVFRHPSNVFKVRQLPGTLEMEVLVNAEHVPAEFQRPAKWTMGDLRNAIREFQGNDLLLPGGFHKL